MNLSRNAKAQMNINELSDISKTSKYHSHKQRGSDLLSSVSKKLGKTKL